ncbi:hypothetical protein DERP_010313 [Dermatophagoides pteronyssinus]|uniref:Uncharacterized protein n=1 Tax=Dermatophagoides pteronyssinus TaxID=6956 RepID=A0ABQ8IYV0_DERPT|nr:hypothetical protein DERP_010313 [Dermatophagoides pteronyssinus]
MTILYLKKKTNYRMIIIRVSDYNTAIYTANDNLVAFDVHGKKILKFFFLIFLVFHH